MVFGQPRSGHTATALHTATQQATRTESWRSDDLTEVALSNELVCCLSHPQNAVVSVHEEAYLALAARYDAIDVVVFDERLGDTEQGLCIAFVWYQIYLLRCEGVCVNVRRL
jgi:hypothetical protein